MFEKFLKDNEDNVISFVTITIIIVSVIIVLFIFANNIFHINSNKKNINSISSENYVDYMSVEYENVVKNVLNTRNIELLYKSLDEKYIHKNNLNEDNVKKFMLDNNFVGNSIAIVSKDVVNQDDVYIFRYYYKNYSNYKYINVIEIKPGDYYISLEQNMDFEDVNVKYSNIVDEVEFDLDVIDKNEESVRYLIKVSNKSSYDVFVDFNDINTFSLIDADGKSYKSSGVVVQNIDRIQPESFVSKELYFTINSENLKKCIGMQVLNIEINGENKELLIEF